MRMEFQDALNEMVRRARAVSLHEDAKEALQQQDARIEDRKKRDADAASDTADLVTIAVVIGVSAAELDALKQRLDQHQFAVIEALQENREQLDIAEAEIEDMLGDAHVLEDGRRVFKTEDDMQVFDEQGSQISLDKIHPNDIENWRPSQEDWLSANEKYDRLIEERESLTEYQQKLDEAQELIDGGTLSRDDFEALEDLLADDVPDAVRRRLPPSEPAAQIAPTAEPVASQEPVAGLDQPGTGWQPFH